MTVDILREILGWCAIVNIGLLLWWFLFLIFAHDFVYRMHTKWFKMSLETFDSIHYAGLVFFKIVVFVFNVIPYLVLRNLG